ncbi:MAG: hypothetical protein HQM09_15330 [Candidatus Riflebacteria bacterium]|nr:hypothetical protein [Candidatus Riflebacteria bacterium]
MIWFFAFTSVGLAMMIFLTILRRTLGLGWKDGLAGIAAIALFVIASR